MKHQQIEQKEIDLEIMLETDYYFTRLTMDGYDPEREQLELDGYGSEQEWKERNRDLAEEFALDHVFRPLMESIS